jgi:hypothetical protein
MAKTETDKDTVVITTKVTLNEKALEYSIKVNRVDLERMDPKAGNKALNEIINKLYEKTNENIKKALNDNI